MNFFLRYLALATCLIGSSMISYNLISQPKVKAQEKLLPKLGGIVRLVSEGRTFCTGTVINDTTILTAAHCVMVQNPFGFGTINTEPVEIRDNDNVPRKVFGKAFYASGQMDQALITGDFSRFEHYKIVTEPVDLTMIRNSFPTFKSCGYPLYGRLYCNTMVYRRPIAFMWAVQGVLLPGMSGGPTLTEDGRVVAVNVAVENDNAVISPVYNVLVNTVEAAGK